ncbi:Ral GTPase-activating protein subunit beta [Halotydeus destructor]|nr:Ral GTPase-activating protein subunit beta [Halotydeus destructor]
MYDSVMFSGISTINATEIAEQGRLSVLNKLGKSVNGQGVVNGVVKSFVQSISFNANSTVNSANESVSNGTVEPAEKLDSDQDVQWVMEVICFGLSLPISTTEQHEAVRDCVHIYCEWMNAMVTSRVTGKSIPVPICQDPNRYFRKMLQHLYNVFKRRPNPLRTSTSNAQELNNGDIVSRQAVLCHRILRQLETICEDQTSKIDNESWSSILVFLLAINDSLLSTPTEKDDIGTNLCQRIVSSLIEVWLIACQRCFPTPSFWKTFHQLCITLRHRQDVVDQWSRVCLCLTQRLVQLSQPSTSPVTAASSLSSPSPSPSSHSILLEMDHEVVSQTWLRFLHAIGNPVDLSNPAAIAKTLRDNGLTTGSISAIDSRHPSLNDLPENFKRAMRGLSWLVNTFLGLPIPQEKLESFVDPTVSPSVPRKPGHKPTAKGIIQVLGGKSTRHQNSTNLEPQSATQAQPPPPSSSTFHLDFKISGARPKVNSVLNILGNWLFSASLLSSELVASEPTESVSLRSNSSASVNSNDFIRKGSTGTRPDTFPQVDDFEAGQAEAVGALCRLFCSKRTDEDIFPVYTARFYIALQHGLSVKEPLRYQVISNILLNSQNLFQLDLQGVNILIPHFLRAMELVMTNTHRVSSTELRRATINIILSLLAYPLHFSELPIKDNLSESSSLLTFQSLRPRLISLMMNALRTETDSLNSQMLLAGFLTCVQDAAEAEADLLVSQDIQNTSSLAIGTENINGNGTEHKYETTSVNSNLSFNIDSTFGKEGIPDTARGLFARTLSLVCNYLISTSKNDTQFSFAALEVLSALARIRLISNDLPALIYEFKRTTKWICDFIVSQCSRPPPSHSKDMHSTIVAAYQTLSVWFHEHPYLLQDRDCLNIVLEVIELGISGSKSKSAGTVQLKATKDIKPVSMRVREAAESLLTSLMNHFGSSLPSPCPPETINGTSSLNESSILKHMKIVRHVTQEEALKSFRFFIVDNSLLLSILSECHSDRTAIIIRSAFGKYCWQLSTKLLPSHMETKPIPDIVPRPLPNESHKPRHKFSFKYFPDSVERIPLTKLDLVMPTFDSLINESAAAKAEHEMVKKRLEQQCMAERQAQQKISAKPCVTEVKEPTPTNTLDPIRLILSHFGFLSSFHSDALKVQPSLVSLDFLNPELRTNLNALDLISTRTSDTIFVYYVRKGRIDPQEILNSVTSKHYVSSHFLDFVTRLGLVIDVTKHAGWSGNVSSAWKAREEPCTPDDYSDMHLDHGGSAYDGLKKAVYWADISHEMAFVVPSGRLSEEDSFSVDSDLSRMRLTDNVNVADGHSMSSGEGTSISSHSYSDTSRHSWRTKSKQSSLMANVGCDSKVIVIWLESIDDQNSLPVETLLQTTRTGADVSTCKDYFLLTIHPLKNGLYRVDLTSSNAKTPFALPLMDNHVVSKRVLSQFVRLTCLNLCRRRRLDADSFQPAHVKRRLKIQDISNKFKTNMNESEFIHSLFY